MSLTMTVSGPASARFGRFNWAEAAGIWGREAAPLGRGMLRAHAPMRTGKLRESISVRHEPSPGRYLIIFYTTVPYAKFVLEGTKPHVIVPRNARVLRWVANRGHGPVRYAMRVHHPGTKPDPFPERALAPIGPAVTQMFARAVREALEA